ncbi:MAG: hypothetical protein CNC89_04835 [Puniceicoccaceae bacterium MED-G31]|nr:MAG: hypothetical protein CNC89_04835 [Puniceicoccaceae bacterium MED-G31]
MNMPKANQSSTLISLLIISLAWLIACSNPEASREKNLLVATELKEIGDYDEALVTLENLRAQSPQDIEVLEQIGQVYLLKDDATMAALFFEQAHEQSPQDIDLLKQTIETLLTADEPAAHLLEKLVDLDSSALTSELWTKLAQHRMAEKQIQGSLQAYLKSVPEKVSETDSSTATALGRLFLLLDNPSQAEYWFINATNSENIDALDALFGLLEIKLSNSDWAQAEEVIAQLDERYPGAVDASDWAKARKQLQRWKEELATTKANLDKANKAREDSLANVEKTPISAERSSAKDLSQANRSIKSDAIADFETMQKIANQPAIDDETTEEQRIAEQINVEFTPPKPNFETLISNARNAQFEGNYIKSIRFYWQALGQANNNPEIWDELSEVYLLDNQLANAETTALEAIRLSPSEIKYTINYLRVAQRNKPSNQFLAELETAYDRFPKNADIALSLARAYDKIANNSTAAGFMYNRFLEISPSHPLRAEADAALERLR